MQKSLVLLASAALALLATAADCRHRDAAPTSTPARSIVDAPIDGLDILVRESFPPGYTLRILSGLPSGCAQFDRAEITGRSDATITVRVTNSVPADPTTACTAIYGTHESFLDLGTDFTSSTTYTVRVNDKTTTFVAQ
jgi:hypothetical protein